ncbi:MAG: hypothetical protein K8J31_32040 [Anaerolineae bacterium]|nr:hypothetical protein [Anaerolineae bacterium]
MERDTTGDVRAVQVEALIDQEIAERVDMVRGMQEHIGALEERISTVKDELRELLVQKGSSWSDDEGYARLVSEGVRRAYNNKALDELIIHDPLRYGWLKDYRKETSVRGGVQVK